MDVVKENTKLVRGCRGYDEMETDDSLWQT